MGELVDLEALRVRLARLGVYVDLPAAGTAAAVAGDIPAGGDGPDAAAARERGAGGEPHSGRIEGLLARCRHVQRDLLKNQQRQPKGVQVLNRDAHASDIRGSGGRGGGRVPGALAALPRDPASRTAAAANGSNSNSSKMLVRAAQNLLRDARDKAQVLDDAALCAAAPLQRRPATGRAGGSRPARAAAASTPLGELLAQYRDAQAVWAQDKAKLRREAETARKKAAQLELELSKLQRAHQHRAGDVSSLRAALKGRDDALGEAQARVKELESTLARAQSAAAERMCALAAERDDLQGLLLATLERLEGVETVVAAADAASADMEDRLRVAEAERAAALELAAAARADAASAREAQRRLAQQSALLDKLGEVQARANERKTAALRELLDDDGGSGEPGGGRELLDGSPVRRAGSRAAGTGSLQQLHLLGAGDAAGHADCLGMDASSTHSSSSTSSPCSSSIELSACLG